MAFDYSEFVAVATELITEFGRSITLLKYDRTPETPLEPWKGPADWNDAIPPVGHRLENVNAVFVGKESNFFSSGPGNERREGINGLITNDVDGFLVSGAIGVDLKPFNTVLDADGVFWHVRAVNTLKPGATVVLYGIEVSR